MPTLSLRGFIDIETLPTADAAVIAELGAEVKAPSNYKDEEKIAAYVAKEQAELIGKTAVDGTYGRVLAIGCALGAGPVEVWIGEELEVLTGFFARVRDAERVEFENAGEYHAEITWIGHNVRAFDLRFLWQRAVINGMRPPRSIMEAAQARPWDKTVIDTMVMWNPERDKKIKMKHLCRALGVPSPKEDLDGSKIAAAWAAGERERIVAYSKAEIEALRACYERMVFEHA